MIKRTLFFLIILFAFFVQKAKSQNVDTLIVPQDTLIVGLKISPPFTIKNDYGYTGLSIDLWEKIAENLHVEYRFKEYDLEHVLPAIENGEVDICISPLTVTSERLLRFDFTQPFFTSKLSIAVPASTEDTVKALISSFFSLGFLKAILVLLFVIFIFGLALWLIERKHNPQFNKKFRGIGDGIWWSAVTMTTVGYGDKAPQSTAGRVLAVVWMYTAIIIISSLTASITSAVTVHEIKSRVETIDDLKSIKVGTLKSSATERFLISQNITELSYFHDVSEGLNALANQEIEAFIYDEPIMRYIMHSENLVDEIAIVPNDLSSQYYSFSLPHGHYLLEQINPILMRELESVNWKGILNKYNLEQ